MARNDADSDDDACAAAMGRDGLTRQRSLVNPALRTLVPEPLTFDEARAMRGAGWDGDLAEMRRPSSPCHGLEVPSPSC